MFNIKITVARKQENKQKLSSIVPGQYGHLHSSTGGMTGTRQVSFIDEQSKLTI